MDEATKTEIIEFLRKNLVISASDEYDHYIRQTTVKIELSLGKEVISKCEFTIAD